MKIKLKPLKIKLGAKKKAPEKKYPRSKSQYV